MRPYLIIAVLLLLLPGCTTVTNGPVPQPQTAFIQASDSDAEMLKTLSEKQTALLEDCEESESCDEVHFTRALLGLFENREAAAASFQRTLEINPTGPFAVSSTQWLEVLSRSPGFLSLSPGTDTTVNGLTEGLVRTWLRQKYVACLSTGKGTAMPRSTGQPSVKVLQRKIYERDKRIAAMAEQLELLKTIESSRSKKLGNPPKPTP